MSGNQAGVIVTPGLINQPIADQPTQPGKVTAKPTYTKPIAYPNLMQDKHANNKVREIIDGHNALKVAHDQTAKTTAANDAAIKALPTSFVTKNDINSQINIALAPTGTITSYVVAILKASGVNVPTTLPPFPPSP